MLRAVLTLALVFAGSAVWANPADINRDGTVDYEDFLILAQEYGKVGTPTRAGVNWIQIFLQVGAAALTGGAAIWAGSRAARATSESSARSTEEYIEAQSKMDRKRRDEETRRRVAETEDKQQGIVNDLIAEVQDNLEGIEDRDHPFVPTLTDMWSIHKGELSFLAQEVREQLRGLYAAQLTVNAEVEFTKYLSDSVRGVRTKPISDMKRKVAERLKEALEALGAVHSPTPRSPSGSPSLLLQE